MSCPLPAAKLNWWSAWKRTSPVKMVLANQSKKARMQRQWYALRYYRHHSFAFDSLPWVAQESDADKEAEPVATPANDDGEEPEPMQEKEEESQAEQAISSANPAANTKTQAPAAVATNNSKNKPEPKAKASSNASAPQAKAKRAASEAEPAVMATPKADNDDDDDKSAPQSKRRRWRTSSEKKKKEQDDELSEMIDAGTLEVQLDCGLDWETWPVFWLFVSAVTGVVYVSSHACLILLPCQAIIDPEAAAKPRRRSK